MKIVEHISYSGLKVWKECPFKFKLNYIDGVAKFQGNIFTAFGSAIHEVCEKHLKNESKQEDAITIFKEAFKREYDALPPHTQQEHTEEKYKEMEEQGIQLAPFAIPALHQKFPNHTIISSEEMLYEPIGEQNIKFKGFVDLLLKHNGQYYVIDWKTCSWGWDRRKKTDPLVAAQLQLYKHFIAKKHNIDPKSIKTLFALLKRTAKKNKVEFLEVISGRNKSKNALELLDKALFFLNKGFYPKNRMSCLKCEVKGTKFCP